MSVLSWRPHTAARPQTPPATDRLAWGWLLIGAALLPLVALTPILPLAAWLAPVFLLRFTRTQRAAVGLPLVALAYYAATALAFRGVFGGPLDYALAMLGIAPVIAYAADKWIATRLAGLPRTLVFPLTIVTLDWLLGLSPVGSGFALAYSQYGNLPLMQLAALTGLWGVSFLVAWAAPVLNDAWERAGDGRAAGRRLGLLGGVLLPVLLIVLLAVLLWGGLRLAFAPDPTPTVRVAMLAADKALWHSLTQSVIEVAQGTPAVREEARAEYAALWDDLLARSRAQARSGAKIIAWSEAAAFALQEDKAARVAQAATLAREEGVYLQIALIVVAQTDRHPYGENRAILIDPSGAVVWDYAKTVHPFGDNAIYAPGADVIPVVDTPYGRLATVICFDADFPALLRQAGQAQVDLLLAPSNDWQPVKVMHSRVHVWRAAEYGFALVRPTGNGIALATDAYGRVLAQADYYAADSLTTVVDVPTRGVTTLYARTGDAFVYLCIAGLMALLVAALLRRAVPVAASPAPAAG
jgi:apolipoprotein N-acyltransferase